MVIPAGDVRRIVAAHCVGARDEVFDGFVQRVTHVQSTVGERRAVVKVEQGLALVLFKHLVVDCLLYTSGVPVRNIGINRSCLA